MVLGALIEDQDYLEVRDRTQKNKQKGKKGK